MLCSCVFARAIAKQFPLFLFKTKLAVGSRTSVCFAAQKHHAYTIVLFPLKTRQPLQRAATRTHVFMYVQRHFVW